MSTTLELPSATGTVRYTLRAPTPYAPPETPFTSRVLYAAAHVVADPAATTHAGRAALDWDATLRYRHHLWDYGFGVAEAMDTAQRGMGLDWATTQELITRSLAEAKARGARIACGAGTDQLNPESRYTLAEIAEAYEAQCAFVESRGGRVILMASRALAQTARGPEDYLTVYGRVLSGVSQPVILHWLGEMFDPALAGYWGSSDWQAAMKTCLELIDTHQDKVEGIKISLLDAAKEVAMRRRLPQGILMYTGDDFNYDALIRGDAEGYSHGLLGIFDAIAPAAAAAMKALDAGDETDYRRILAPTVPLSRHIFAAPTFYYKTGIVFMAYLNGHQEHFTMVGGLETQRSALHLSTLFQLADGAGLLRDPELAAARMQGTLAALRV